MGETSANNSKAEHSRQGLADSRGRAGDPGDSYAKGKTAGAGTGTHHSSDTHHSHSGSSSHSHSHSSHRKHSSKNGAAARFSNWLKSNNKLFLKICAVVLVVIAIVVVLIIVSRSDEGPEAIDVRNSDERQMLYYDDAWYTENTDLEVILVMGLDKMSDQARMADDAYINFQQNDFNALVIIDHTARKYDILQLNRDTMTEVKMYGLNSAYVGTELMQLALAHTYGTGGKDSCRNAVEAVSELLYGIQIDHYVSFTMDAVPILNDAVDGVTVTIEDDFGEGSRFEKGKEVTLWGEDALTFVRSRGNMQDDTTNLARMDRQKAYLTALRTRLIKKLNSSTSWAAKTLGSIADYLTSDLGYYDLASILNDISGYRLGSILTTQGEAITKDFVEYYLDEEALRKQVVSLFYVKNKE